MSDTAATISSLPRELLEHVFSFLSLDRYKHDWKSFYAFARVCAFWKDPALSFLYRHGIIFGRGQLERWAHTPALARYRTQSLALHTLTLGSELDIIELLDGCPGLERLEWGSGCIAKYKCVREILCHPNLADLKHLNLGVQMDGSYMEETSLQIPFGLTSFETSLRSDYPRSLLRSIVDACLAHPTQSLTSLDLSAIDDTGELEVLEDLNIFYAAAPFITSLTLPAIDNEEENLTSPYFQNTLNFLRLSINLNKLTISTDDPSDSEWIVSTLSKIFDVMEYQLDSFTLLCPAFLCESELLDLFENAMKDGGALTKLKQLGLPFAKREKLEEIDGWSEFIKVVETKEIILKVGT